MARLNDASLALVKNHLAGLMTYQCVQHFGLKDGEVLAIGADRRPVCRQADGLRLAGGLAVLFQNDLAAFTATAPMMPGAYLTCHYARFQM